MGEALVDKRRMVCVYVGLKTLEQDVLRTGLPYALNGKIACPYVCMYFGVSI